MQPASLLRGSENIKTDDKDTPPPHLSTLSHQSEDTAWSTFSAALVSASSLSPSPNLDYPISALIAMSSTLFDSSSGNPPNTQTEGTEEASHENSLSAYGGLSFLLPSSPCITLYTTSDFHFPSSSVSPPQIESLSQSLKNNQKYSLFQGSGGCLSDAPTNTHRKDEETPSSLSFQLYKDNPLAPIPSLVLDSKSKFNNGCTTLPCLSPNPSIPVRQSAFSSKSCDPDGLIVPAVGTISDMTEQSISPQDRSYCHDDNTDSEDTLQINGKGEVEGEKHSDTVQTGEAVVYNSDTESSASLSVSTLVSKDVCNKTEILHELPTKNKQEESRKVCHMDINVSESESTRSSSVLHDDAPEAQNRTKVETKDLTEIDSLDLVFQTSVDGSEGENGDVDAFFRQVDTEGLVYWAEPIQVSNSTPVPEESDSSEASDGCSGNYLLPRDPAALDSFPSDRHMPLSVSSPTTIDTDHTLRNASTASSNTPFSLTVAPFPSPLAIPDLKSSSRSVSVQMSSSLSSHIVHRKDIPYMTNSKCTLLSSVLPLDTSTPFRAVQSWTDLQIQRNTLTNKLSRGALHTVPNKVSVYTSASETTQRPTLTHDCFPGMARNDRTVSVSVDKGLWPDEEVDRNGNEDEDKLWEGNQPATMACDHQCTCRTQKSYNKQHTLGNIPVSNNTLSILYPYSAFFFLSFNQTQESYPTSIAFKCVTFRLQSSSVTCLSGLNVHWKYYRIEHL